MISTNIFRKAARHVALLFAGATLLAVLGTLVLNYLAEANALRSRQAVVAERGALVMPFDLEQTTHVFEPQPSGGVQRVTADDPTNTRQIALIQAHLEEEARKFRQGDFADPAAIHGVEMPGLSALRAGASQIEVRYTTMPDGAQITYRADDPGLVRALHQWFAAQLSDHGHHASDHEE